MNLKRTTLICLIAAAAFGACKKDDPITPEVEVAPVKLSEYITQYSNGVIEVRNYPIDMTRNNSVKDDYFNFDSHLFISKDKALTKEWDIAFRSINSQVWANEGTRLNTPWTGNGSQVRLCGIMKNFDEVSTVVPSELNFTDGFSSTISVYPQQETPYEQLRSYWSKGVYTELGALDYIVPDPNRCFIIRLNDGRYVKFQYINLYDTEPLKNSSTSKKGFLSFRYFIGKGENVKTK